MPLYESVFIARQDISSSQAEALADTFAEIVASNGGTVSKKEYWGLRNLTYRIKKNRKGHYTLLNIDAPPGVVAELERNMRIHDDVLRYLTVKVDELEAGPSAILRSREERAPRGGGRGGRRDDDRPRRPRPDFAGGDAGPPERTGEGDAR
ncbi:MAG: 30S ribosomal protein S6 [Alphaproteobacteria bacterium]|jgi:small subunit ribosomal protein S6|nr:30S ribosomal protein S6 [Alphaproteobacteria bacterium]